MLSTTFDALKFLLRADPSISTIERNQLLAGIRNGSLKPGSGESTRKAAERVVRREEASKRFSYSARTIDRLAREGILHKIRLPGRKRAAGFLESELVAAMTGRGAA
jgi:hypothetical protein